MKTFRFDVSESCYLTYEIEAENEEAAKRFVYEEMETYVPVFNRRKTKRKIILYHRAFGVDPMSKKDSDEYDELMDMGIERVPQVTHTSEPDLDYFSSHNDD